MELRRIFFALRPPLAVAADAAGLGQRLALEHGGRPMGADVLHVSLLHVPASSAAIMRAKAAAARVAHPAFRLAFNRLATFGKGYRRPLVLMGQEGVIRVHQLRGAIHAQMRAVHLADGPPRQAEPHMSLVWGEREVAERAVAPLGWRAEEFALLCSHVGKARHEILGRWPLGVGADEEDRGHGDGEDDGGGPHHRGRQALAQAGPAIAAGQGA